MTRQTTVSLLAAAAFGVVMAAATMASGEINQGGSTLTQYDPYNCGPAFSACFARCAPAGSPPEQRARCEQHCRAQMDPMDCQYLRRPQTTSPAATVQGAQRRR
jgi:hypothetical protein